MFAVVRFVESNEMEVVPTIWLNGKPTVRTQTVCFFPNRDAKLKCKKKSPPELGKGELLKVVVLGVYGR